MKIAYLGDENSHTHVAAMRLKQAGDVLIGYPTITKAISSVSRGETGACVVPIENSYEGSVLETLDAQTEGNLYIQKEIIMPIRQTLLGRADCDICQLEVIASHPQALSQCRLYLANNYPNCKCLAVNSTSEGVKLAACDPRTACIARDITSGHDINSSKDTDANPIISTNENKPSASSAGADKRDSNSASVSTYKLDSNSALNEKEGERLRVIAANIEDAANNVTRFVLLSEELSFHGTKASIVLEAENRPRGLVSVLNVFGDNSLNMTRIESRPHKSGLGRYIFFIDFDCALEKPKFVEFLSQLSTKTQFLKFLGKY